MMLEYKMMNFNNEMDQLYGLGQCIVAIKCTDVKRAIGQA